jgi:hypothetical protein
MWRQRCLKTGISKENLYRSLLQKSLWSGPKPQTQGFRYELVHQSRKSRARAGVIHTPHGRIETPTFVGVGTHATMKSLTSQQTRATGLQLMFWYKLDQ